MQKKTKSSKTASKTVEVVPPKKVEALDEKNLKAFTAIVNFVGALYEEFGTNNKPLALYNRLLSKMSLSDPILIKKHTRVFKIYVIEYKKYLTSGKLTLPLDAKIEYNERIYIDLPRFINQSDTDTLDVIKSHLLTIASILNPADNEMLNNLEKLSKQSLVGLDGSKEGEFLGGMMETLQGALGGEGGEGFASFLPMVTEMMGSGGVFQEMMGGLKNGMESGKMDPKKLVGNIKNLMNGLMDQLENAGEGDATATADAVSTTTTTTTTTTSTIDVKSENVD